MVFDKIQRQYILSGADRWAEEWALSHSVYLKIFPAQWGKYGKAAGPIRNKIMAEYLAKKVLVQDKIVTAFPGDNGTENMIKCAYAHALPIMRCDPSLIF